MPLSEKARIEVYLPDLPKRVYQNLLEALEQEFIYNRQYEKRGLPAALPQLYLRQEDSMATRIIFNGQEYTSVEAMPEQVRRAYQQTLAQLADTDRNGIPDILERGAAANVIGIQQSSITVNGQTYNSVGEMPAAVRWLYEQAMGQMDANRNGIPDALEAALSGLPMPPPSADAMRPELTGAGDVSTARGPHDPHHFETVLDQTARVLDTFLWVLLSTIAVAVGAGGVFLILTMDRASQSQGGRLYVAVGAVVLLGAVDTQVGRLVRRRAPFDSTGYRRYQLVSLLLLVCATLLLVGLALFLP